MEFTIPKASKKHKQLSADKFTASLRTCPLITPSPKQINTIKSSKTKTNKIKSQTYLSLDNDSIFQDLRPKLETIPDKCKNMISEVIKVTKRNFTKTYKRHEFCPRSKRHKMENQVITNKIQHSNAVSMFFSSLNRCYIEDFMILPNKSLISILIPTFDSGIMEYFEAHTEEVNTSISFGNKEYLLLQGYIHASPFHDQIKCGMTLTDVKQGFGHMNYGCYVSFVNCDNLDPLLITWKSVRDGGASGVQVWYNATNPYDSHHL